MPDPSKSLSRCPIDGQLIARPAILCDYHWLELPRELSDRVRREFCVNGEDSESYREAVRAAIGEAESRA